MLTLVDRKEYKLVFSERQRSAILLLLAEAEARLDLKRILPGHGQRSSLYKAMKKLRTAVPRTPKEK